MDNRELFVNFYKNSESVKDIDPGIWLSKYLVERLELNRNQTIWFCFLNAITYQLPTAFMLINEYPDMELVDIDRITSWWDKVQKDCPFQQDKLKQRKYLPETIESYQRMVGEIGEAAYFDKILSGTAEENFEVLWEEAYLPIRHFGRFSVWNWAQMLKHVAGYDIEPTSMMFGNGAESITHGMCHVIGWEDKTYKKRYKDDKGRRKKEVYKFSKEESRTLEQEAKALKVKLGCSYFELETVLCAFKKLFRERDSRYVGYYHHRQGSDIRKLELLNWHGVPWFLLRQARKENLSLIHISDTVDKDKFKLNIQEKIK
jgi:hypothetical protein